MRFDFAYTATHDSIYLFREIYTAGQKFWDAYLHFIYSHILE